MEATFFPPWSSSDAERWCFGGVNMCTLTGLYAAPYATNCDATCILISSDPALTFFPAIKATVTRLLDQHGSALVPHQ